MNLVYCSAVGRHFRRPSSQFSEMGVNCAVALATTVLQSFDIEHVDSTRRY